MPVLTSRLPPRVVYLCAIKSPISGIRLATHIRINIRAVHVQIARPRMFEEDALSRFSSHMITAPTIMASIVLEMASGVIQGLPVQITVLD